MEGLQWTNQHLTKNKHAVLGLAIGQFQEIPQEGSLDKGSGKGEKWSRSERTCNKNRNGGEREIHKLAPGEDEVDDFWLKYLTGLRLPVAN